MEQTIRKNWLISLFITMGFGILHSIVLYSSIEFSIKYFSLYLKIASISFLVLGGAVSYYLGYKKRKTGWLTFIVAFRTISLIGTFLWIGYAILVQKNYFAQTSSAMNLSTWIFTTLWFFSTLISLYYTYSSYLLRKTTKQAKAA